MSLGTRPTCFADHIFADLSTFANMDPHVRLTGPHFHITDPNLAFMDPLFVFTDPHFATLSKHYAFLLLCRIFVFILFDSHF